MKIYKKERGGLQPPRSAYAIFYTSKTFKTKPKASAACNDYLFASFCSLVKLLLRRSVHRFDHCASLIYSKQCLADIEF
jgi:hypothetical protein